MSLLKKKKTEVSFFVSNSHSEVYRGCRHSYLQLQVNFRGSMSAGTVGSETAGMQTHGLHGKPVPFNIFSFFILTDSKPLGQRKLEIQPVH